MSKKMIRHLKAVVFIMIGLGLVASYIVVISGQQPFFVQTYQYHLHLKDAGGLFEGSYVTLNGMKVGNVYTLSMKDGHVVATLGIKKRFSQFITKSSVALLKTEGLLGDRYVSIQTTTSSDSEEDNQPLENQSYIPMSPSSGLLGSIKNNEDLIAGFNSLIQETTKLLSQLNKKENGKSVVVELKQLSAKAKKFLSEENKENISDILKHINSILKKIDTGKGTAGAIVNDPSLHNKALSALGKKPYARLLKIFFSGASSSAIED